jgi:hypothetical protein
MFVGPLMPSQSQILVRNRKSHKYNHTCEAAEQGREVHEHIRDRSSVLFAVINGCFVAWLARELGDGGRREECRECSRLKDKPKRRQWMIWALQWKETVNKFDVMVRSKRK